MNFGVSTDSELRIRIQIQYSRIYALTDVFKWDKCAAFIYNIFKVISYISRYRVFIEICPILYHKTNYL